MFFKRGKQEKEEEDEGRGEEREGEGRRGNSGWIMWRENKELKNEPEKGLKECFPTIQ